MIFLVVHVAQKRGDPNLPCFGGYVRSAESGLVKNRGADWMFARQLRSLHVV